MQSLEQSQTPARPPKESILESVSRNIQEGLQTGRLGLESGYRDTVRNLGEGYESARASIKSGLEDARINLVSGLESARQGINYGITRTQEGLAVPDKEERPVHPIVNTRPAAFTDDKAQLQGGGVVPPECNPDAPPYEDVQREDEGDSLEEMTRRLERAVQARGLLSRNPPRQMESGPVGASRATDLGERRTQ
jgi:hypothetical protein